MDFMNKHFSDKSVTTYMTYLNFEKCKQSNRDGIG